MAQLSYPYGVFVSDGEIFICDTGNHRVRKVLRNGQIVTICGTGIPGYTGDGDGGLATHAQLYIPHSVFVSSSNQVYISEMGGNRIRKIDSHGIISTIAGKGQVGHNGEALKIYPCGLFVTDEEEVLFADESNNCVKKMDRNGMVTTIAGTGYGHYNGDDQLATSAMLYGPTSVFQYKREIYISDCENDRIRKIDRFGTISTIAESINTYPCALFVHNDELYWTTSTTHLVLKLLPNGTVKTIVGMENQCKLLVPKGIFVDVDSQIYIADTLNHCIRIFDQNGMMIRVIGIAGQTGYSGDVPFDFQKFPHVGTRKKELIKPFPHAYHDLIVICVEVGLFDYEPAQKIKY